MQSSRCALLIPTSQIENWHDLQDKVAMLFREMGYEATTPFTVDLAGRGKKEVDAYIHDPRASVNQIMLAECKFWESTVPQDTVHSFHTVMNGAGANTGFIISKAGFQSGAYEAAKSTNIHLLTWDELQHKFGRQWYIYKSEARDRLLAELRAVNRGYLDQFDPAPISNTMFFNATGVSGDLHDILVGIRVALFAAMAGPSAYDVPGPIEVQVFNDGFPGATTDCWGLPTLMLADVREFFNWLESYGREQLDRLEALRIRAHRSFDELPDDAAEAAIANMLRRHVEDMPIRTFKEALGDETYNRLINQRLSRKGAR
jgi:Restriction endonuclease